ncbi:hypothetical protein JXB11_02540 [Candidatus Woesearchaeota archaeon]|nr:hypothetical protein [Candidatus Woesearchaeota archaeon]
MKVLNLVIHKELVEADLNAPEHVLERIAEIEAPGTDVAQIPFSLAIDNRKEMAKAPEMAKGYDLVVLYGVSRDCCLGTVARHLHKAGIPVTYDISGTYSG